MHPNRLPRTTKAAPTLATLAILGLLVAPPATEAATVDESLAAAVARGGSAEALVVLAEQADLSGIDGLPTREDKGREVHRRLTTVAQRTQAPLLAWLAARGVEARPLWIVNLVVAHVDGPTLEALAERPEVARISANPRVANRLPTPQPMAGGGRTPEPGIDSTGAPEVFWAAGITGEGVVVAAADSGQAWTHPALIDAYRGWDGETAGHDHNWWDAIHTGGGRCGTDSQEPCDDTDHGTATLGVVVGDDGAGNQIGMAPGARWIGCRNMDQGVGTPATYMECFQFFLAPTDLQGNDPRPELAPHVVNNSWRCPPDEGCTDPEVLRASVEALTTAGIVVVASAGNDGPGCESVDAPPAIYDAAWTVGSVNFFGEVSGFSARGPVSVDGSDRLKPDFVSVGEDVRSSIPPADYAGFDGTSMSGPHVTGLAALMISAQPCLAGELDAMEFFLRANTVSLETSEECGGVPGDQVPNNTYGWGIVMAALPGPELCSGVAIGGTVSGLTPLGAACRDLTNGDTTLVPLGGAEAWDCTGAGFSADPGDPVGTAVRGDADGTTVQGTVNGFVAEGVVCRNESLGTSVAGATDGTNWSCGVLAADPGDRVTSAVRGTVPGALANRR